VVPLHRSAAVRLAGALAIVLAAVPASADGVFTPYVGSNFAGTTDKNSTAFGASIGAISGSGLGFEIDVGYTPDFLARGVADGNATTVMGNLVFAAPPSGAGLRPYVSGGLGLIRFNVTGVGNVFDASRNDLGVNAGAGLMIFVTRSVGLRGDLRYFRSLQDSNDSFAGLDLGDFDFWRGSVGVTFKW
jgi:opacity protein-like surface antigen